MSTDNSTASVTRAAFQQADDTPPILFEFVPEAPRAVLKVSASPFSHCSGPRMWVYNFGEVDQNLMSFVSYVTAGENDTEMTPTVDFMRHIISYSTSDGFCPWPLEVLYSFVYRLAYSTPTFYKKASSFLSKDIRQPSLYPVVVADMYDKPFVFSFLNYDDFMGGLKKKRICKSGWIHSRLQRALKTAIKMKRFVVIPSFIVSLQLTLTELAQQLAVYQKMGDSVFVDRRFHGGDDELVNCMRAEDKFFNGGGQVVSDLNKLEVTCFARFMINLVDMDTFESVYLANEFDDLGAMTAYHANVVAFIVTYEALSRWYMFILNTCSLRKCNVQPLVLQHIMEARLQTMHSIIDGKLFRKGQSLYKPKQLIALADRNNKEYGSGNTIWFFSQPFDDTDPIWLEVSNKRTLSYFIRFGVVLSPKFACELVRSFEELMKATGGWLSCNRDNPLSAYNKPLSKDTMMRIEMECGSAEYVHSMVMLGQYVAGSLSPHCLVLTLDCGTPTRCFTEHFETYIDMVKVLDVRLQEQYVRDIIKARFPCGVNPRCADTSGDAGDFYKRFTEFRSVCFDPEENTPKGDAGLSSHYCNLQFCFQAVQDARTGDSGRDAAYELFFEQRGRELSGGNSEELVHGLEEAPLSRSARRKLKLDRKRAEKKEGKKLGKVHGAKVESADTDAARMTNRMTRQSVNVWKVALCVRTMTNGLEKTKAFRDADTINWKEIGFTLMYTRPYVSHKNTFYGLNLDMDFFHPRLANSMLAAALTTHHEATSLENIPNSTQSPFPFLVKRATVVSTADQLLPEKRHLLRQDRYAFPGKVLGEEVTLTYRDAREYSSAVIVKIRRALEHEDCPLEKLTLERVLLQTDGGFQDDCFDPEAYQFLVRKSWKSWARVVRTMLKLHTANECATRQSAEESERRRAIRAQIRTERERVAEQERVRTQARMHALQLEEDGLLPAPHHGPVAQPLPDARARAQESARRAKSLEAVAVHEAEQREKNARRVREEEERQEFLRISSEIGGSRIHGVPFSRHVRK